jgi:vacuolar-type H+-ATPase subunit F/Vma7
MSEKMEIIAVGHEDFAIPFAMVGLGCKITENQKAAEDFIASQDNSRISFLVDEEIIDDISRIEEMELSGANILILKAWGVSALAKKRIRDASIRAIGAEIGKDEPVDQPERAR